MCLESSFSLTASNVKKLIVASIFNVKPISVAVFPNNLHYGTLNTVVISTTFLEPYIDLSGVYDSVEILCVCVAFCLGWYTCRALAVRTQGSNICTSRGRPRLEQCWETGRVLRTGVSQAWLQTPANKLTLLQMLTPMIETKWVSISAIYALFRFMSYNWSP